MDWFENLRALKAKSNMSMREIAIKSEIPEPTLEKIFSGATKSPGVNTIQSLVHALGYTLDDIDSGSNKKNAPPYSSEAMKLAKDYDGLDKHGKRIVRVVADEEKARMADKTVSASTPKLDIATEVASYQAELELQEKAKEKLSAFDGQKGTGAKMA